MTSINRIELGWILTQAKLSMQSPTLSDRYRLVTVDWLVNVFGPSAATALAQFNLARNTDRDGWDCTDLCLWGLTYARMLNALDGGPKESIAIGLIGYGGLTIPGHAVLGAITENRTLAYWDPTKHRQVELTEYERQECRVIIF